MNLMQNPYVVVKNFEDKTITLDVNGEPIEISNQLEELKTILLNLKVPTIQYADKIYNIEQINEANFGFISGKMAFNELLTKQLIECIKPHSKSAQLFLEKVASIDNWESQPRICDKAKEIIAYSFVGVIGIQLSKLMAIGKEEDTNGKAKKYIEKSLYIVKRCMDLAIYVMLSQLWDAQKNDQVNLSIEHRNLLHLRFENAFELSIVEQFELLKSLCFIFSDAGYKLELIIPEKTDVTDLFAEKRDLGSICIKLQAINDSLDKSMVNLMDCFEVEKLTAEFFKCFHFLARYKMASIKHIGYQEIRNTPPRYIHRYAALGIDSKANIDAEKINYSADTVNTDAVLIYQGDHYQKNINLFPFVIDYNALTFEHGSKICFYSSKDITDGSLEYMFLEDGSFEKIDFKGVLTEQTNFNEFMLNMNNRKEFNLDHVVEQFGEANKSIVGNLFN